MANARPSRPHIPSPNQKKRNTAKQVRFRPGMVAPAAPPVPVPVPPAPVDVPVEMVPISFEVPPAPEGASDAA